MVRYIVSIVVKAVRPNLIVVIVIVIIVLIRRCNCVRVHVILGEDGSGLRQLHAGVAAVASVLQRNSQLQSADSDTLHGSRVRGTHRPRTADQHELRVQGVRSEERSRHDRRLLGAAAHHKQHRILRCRLAVSNCTVSFLFFSILCLFAVYIYDFIITSQVK